MIAFLTGSVLEKQPPYLVIDVNGVGYECLASDHTFARLPDTGGEIGLYTHLVVREDAHTLFAFVDRNERFLFRHLLKVSGVGPKLAITILSSADVNTLSQSILDQNVAVLTQIPGIGKKTAERLVMEMRDRLAKSWPTSEINLPSAASTAGSVPVKSIAEKEAVDGLISLGYKPQTAAQLIRQVQANGNDPALSAEQLLRNALQKVHEA